MAIDASIYNQLGVGVTPLMNPLDIQARKIAIRNALAGGQMQDIQLQQAQQSLADDQATRAAAHDYYTPGASPAAVAPPPVAPGGGGALPFDPQTGMNPDPTGGASMAAPSPASAPPSPGAAPTVPAPPPIPTMAYLVGRNVPPAQASALIQQFQKVDETNATIQQTRANALKLQKEANDLIAQQAAQMADGIIKATPAGQPVNPDLLSWNLQHFASLGPQEAAQAQQVGAHLAQLAPADQIAFLGTLTNTPKQMEANAAQTTANEKKQTSDREAANQARGQALSALAAAPNSAAYGAIWGQLSPELRKDASIPKPEQWTPKTAAVLQHTGQSSDQQVTTAQTASHNAATEANERTARALEARRISIEQAKFDYQKSGGDYISNPAFIDGVVNGEIKINPRDKNFAAISTAAKEQDSTWTSDRYDNRQHFMQSITSGPLSKQVQSINQGLAHLGEFKAASDKVGIMNAVPGGSYISGDVKAMKNSADTSGHELTVMFSQGAGTQHEVDQTQGNLGGLTQSVRNDGVKQYAKLVGGRLRAIAKQYVSATGEEFPVDRFLDSGAADLLKSQGIDAYKIAKDESQTWMKSRGAAPAAPAPVNPHALAQAQADIAKYSR